MNGLRGKRSGRERGMILIVVLIMLGIMTVIVAAVVRTGNINFQIAGNQQYRQEARMAAQSAIEDYISNPTNFDTPPATTASYGLDLDGDQTAELSASVAPAVEVGSVQVPPESLLPDQALFTKCSVGTELGGLTIDSDQGPAAQNYHCAYKVYDVGATVADQTTGTSVEIHQGIKRLSKLN